MTTRAGIAALLLSPGICRMAPNAHPPSVLDALIMAEDYLAGRAVFPVDREPEAQRFVSLVPLWKLR